MNLLGYVFWAIVLGYFATGFVRNLLVCRAEFLNRNIMARAHAAIGEVENATITLVAAQNRITESADSVARLREAAIAALHEAEGALRVLKGEEGKTLQ